MFPKELDGAKVLYYAPQDDYGAIRYPDGEIADKFRYLAICKYAKDEGYYLFCCDEKYDVVSDWLYTSIEECMESASRYKENIIWNEGQLLFISD